MRFNIVVPLIGSVLSLTAINLSASSGSPFYGDPPDNHHPWAVHDQNRPQPKVVTPGTFSSDEQPGRPPSDAVVLFDGADLSNWESSKDGSPAKWLVKDGAMQVTETGAIRTKAEFGDCQLHVEWAEPTDVTGESQGRGNSGIFLMGRVEIQVLDSYHNETYADGSAGSVYGVNPPMANALRPPGEYQVYDIVFRRPIYRNGRMLDPGYVTVFVNGVLVQDHAELEGPTAHMVRIKPVPFPDKGPLELQDHGNPVRYRNIWYRTLPPRAIEGGTDGRLTIAATMAKRRAIAASIRQDADHLNNPDNPLPEMLRRMESLVYEKDQPTVKKVNDLAEQYISALEKLDAAPLAAKKDEVKNVKGDFDYLVKFNILPATFEPKVQVEQIIKNQGWDKKK